MTPTPFQTYAALLVRLHAEMAAGRDTGSDSEADSIRTWMDDPWYAMSDDEEQLADELSAQLYDMSGMGRRRPVGEWTTRPEVVAIMDAVRATQTPAERDTTPVQPDSPLNPYSDLPNAPIGPQIDEFDATPLPPLPFTVAHGAFRVPPKSQNGPFVVKIAHNWPEIDVFCEIMVDAIGRRGVGVGETQGGVVK